MSIGMALGFVGAGIGVIIWAIKYGGGE